MTFGSTPPVTPVKQPRRRDPKQTTFEFRPTGRGGARPGAGRPRKYRSRMPHRSREPIPGYCPVLVTLRVRDDDHVHLIVEAAGKVRLANGMKSVGARFARCVNRTFGRRDAVLKERFHHVVKRTPTEVRRALAYVLLNVRKHYRQRRKRIPPVVLNGASSGLWFDGWRGRSPPPGRYADPGRAREVAADRADRSGGGAGRIAGPRRLAGLSTLRPRRRSPSNEGAVGEGWATPTEVPDRGEGTTTAPIPGNPARCRLRPTGGAPSASVGRPCGVPCSPSRTLQGARATTRIAPGSPLRFVARVAHRLPTAALVIGDRDRG